VGEVEQQIQVGRLPLPRQDPLENLRGPRGAFATLRALGARVVRVEPGESHDLVDHVGRIVEHDHAAGPEHRAFLDYALVVEETALGLLARSEERRVGKECRYRWWPCRGKRKRNGATSLKAETGRPSSPAPTGSARESSWSTRCLRDTACIGRTTRARRTGRVA